MPLGFGIFCLQRHACFVVIAFERFRLNYATIYHHPSPLTSIQNISTTTHHHLPSLSTSQNISTTTHHHLQNEPPISTSRNIFIYNLLLSFFFFENTIVLYVMEILCDKVMITLCFKLKTSFMFYNIYDF